MIVITKAGFDPPRDRRCSLQVKEDIGMPEQTRGISASMKGRTQTVMVPVVLDSGQTVLRPKGQKTNLGKEKIWISPLLDITVKELSPDLIFGNGTTGPMALQYIRDGEARLEYGIVTVFPYGTVLTVAQCYRMQEIFEGIPPGSDKVNVWRPFDSEGRVIVK